MSATRDLARWHAPLALTVILLALGTAAAWADGSVVAWGYNAYGQCDAPAPNDDFSALSAGYLHNLGLKLDGAMIAWGDNTFAQCEPPEPNSSFIAVAAGGYHSLALKADGAIVAWGFNTYHQCDVPAPNTDFVAVAAGYQYSLGLKSDGRIIAWGDNAYGQCDVPTGVGFIALAAGYYHGLGLKADGSIAAWGCNYSGEGTLPTPNSGFVALAAGESFSLALKSDGSIRAWGYNVLGQCTVPSPNSGFVAVSAGQAHSLALRTDGTVLAWGFNVYGQCNVPTSKVKGIAISAGGYHSLALNLNSALPATPSSPRPADTAAGVLVNCDLHWNSAWSGSCDVCFGTTNPPPLLCTTLATYCACPLLACGTTYYWQVVGRNWYGTSPGPVWSFSTEAPPPPDTPASPGPSNGSTNVPTDMGLTWTAAGATSYDVYLGVTDLPPLVGSTGTPSWARRLEGGLRWYWQIAARNDCASTPGPVWTFTTSVVAPAVRAWGRTAEGQCDVPPPNTDFVAVAAGAYHSVGLKADGSMAAWGLNDYGQCNVPPPNTDFVAVSAGSWHSLGLKANGSIVAWGAGQAGQSGWPNSGQCIVPAPNSGFIAVAGGDGHSMGLKADGSIAAWGGNGDHQCNVPAPNAGFVAVAAGEYHSIALKADGSIVAWGRNSSGQCRVPVPNSGFVRIAAGPEYNLGLKADGSIVAWGNNAVGQCNVPSPNTGFVGISAGGGTGIGLRADGSIVAWGLNDDGERTVPAPNTGFASIAVGWCHTLAIGSGGTLPAQASSPSPSDGATGVTLAGTSLYWPPVALATSYDLYFGTTNPPPLLATTQANIRPFPPFACGTTYYWQVVSRNCNGSAAGMIWSFRTQEVALPDSPTAPSPADGATNIPLGVTLGWTADGATSYDVYWGVTNPPPLLGTTSANQWSPPPLACSRTYYWQVVSRNCAGTTTGPLWTFRTPEVALPALPTAPSPADGVTNIPLAVTLGWTADGATSYDVYCGVTNPPPLVGTTSQNGWSLSPLACATTYYWQVVSRNCAGTTFSPLWTFSTTSLSPEAPAEPTPPDGGGDVSTDAALAWTGAEATSYDVYFGATNPPPLLGTTSATRWVLPPLTCATTYHWQVAPRNCAGTTPGAVWSFTTRNAPNPPRAPNPPDDGVGIATSPILRWTAEIGMTYDVYLGRTDPPPMVGSTTTRSWTPPQLDGFATYYWRIASKDSCGTTLGPVWSFTSISLRPGDVNGDGVVSFADINAFVYALFTTEADFTAAYPIGRRLNADVNGDGVLSFADINPFVSCLAHGGCP